MGTTGKIYLRQERLDKSVSCAVGRLDVQRLCANGAGRSSLFGDW